MMTVFRDFMTFCDHHNTDMYTISLSNRGYEFDDKIKRPDLNKAFLCKHAGVPAFCQPSWPIIKKCKN